MNPKSDMKYVFFNNPCHTWTSDNVIIFLKFLGANKTIQTAFRINKIVGLHLLVMSNDILRKDLKIKSLSHRLSLMLVFEELKKKEGIFNPKSPFIPPLQKVLKTGIIGHSFGSTHLHMDEETKLTEVRKKMLERLGGRKPSIFSDEQFDQYCKNLISKELLVSNYLNKEFRGIRKLLSELPKARTSLSLIPNSSPMMSTMTTTRVNGGGGDGDEEGDEEGQVLVFDDIPSNVLEILDTEELKSPYQIQRKNTISVKLVITELSPESKKKAFRKLISPIMFGLNFQQEFGIFHAALIVGPWYLEWNNSSLCIPRKCYSKAAVFAADLTRLYKGKIDDVVNKVADVVVQWNATKIYDQKSCNCQHFVDDVLSNLGIRIPYDGSLGIFLDQLRKQGKCEMVWKPSSSCLKMFPFLKKTYRFRTHMEIDELFLRIQKKEPLWGEKSDIQQDIMLVKAFDRAFWLRYYADDKNLTFKPHKQCPFGDPSNSSIVREWF